MMIVWGYLTLLKMKTLKLTLNRKVTVTLTLMSLRMKMLYIQMKGGMSYLWLVDGRTWAIKKIWPNWHNYRGLETYNPICDVK